MYRSRKTSHNIKNTDIYHDLLEHVIQEHNDKIKRNEETSAFDRSKSDPSAYKFPECGDKYTLKTMPCNAVCRSYPPNLTMDPGLRYQMAVSYRALNMCQAPLNFDTRYREASNPSKTILPNHISSLLSSYLHLAYGDIVIPGVWSVNPNTHQITRVESAYYLPTLNATPITSLTTIQEVIEYIRHKSLERVHVMYLSVPSESRNGLRHAMLVTFLAEQARRRRIKAYVTDPNMHFNSELLDIAKDVLEPHLGHGTVFTLMRKDLKGKFQAMNSKAEYSIIDRHGYCSVWTLLLMELTSRAIRLNPLASLKDIASFHLPAPLTTHNPFAWRKFIVDYLFSRMMDAYALAVKLNKRKVVSFIQATVLDKYIRTVDVFNLTKHIIMTVPGFQTRGKAMAMAHKDKINSTVSRT